MRHIPIVLILTVLSLFGEDLFAQGGSYTDVTQCLGTFLGGKAKDESYIMDIAVDNQGYVYGCGWTTAFPTTPGVYQGVVKGSMDAFVFKLSPKLNTLVWATYIGGSNDDCAGSIAINAAGEVYVSGYTNSANFPTTTPSDASYLANGQSNVFAAKLNATGSVLMYSRILGRTTPVQKNLQNASRGACIALSGLNDAYVLSQTSSGTLYNITANAAQPVLKQGVDLVVTKLSPTGVVTYSSYLGGSGDEYVRDLCVNGAQLYVCGSTTSADMPTLSGRTPQAADCYIMSLTDNAGVISPNSCFAYGSNGADVGTSMCVDAPRGRILLTGVCNNSTAPITSSLLGGQNFGGFVASIDLGLSSLQFFTIVGTGVDARSVAVASDGSFFVGSYTISTAPTTPNAFQLLPKASGMEGSLTHVDVNGVKLLNGTYLGGSMNDYSCATVVVVEHRCVTSVYFALTSHSPDFPTTPNVIQPKKNNEVKPQPTVSIFSVPHTDLLTISGVACSADAKFELNTACGMISAAWDFGDSTQGSGLTTTHHYKTASKFNVTVFIQDSEAVCNTIHRTFEPRWFPAIAGPDKFVCAKNPAIQLTAGPAAFYRWSPGADFSDPSIRNPIVRATKTTTYILYVVDIYGCASYDTMTVYVDDIKPGISRDTIICVGESIKLRATGANKIHWLPESDVPVNDVSDIVVTPKVTTTFLAIMSSGYCLDTERVTIQVSAKPKLNMPSALNICTGGSCQLTASLTVAKVADTSGMVYYWSPTTNMLNPNSLSPTVQPLTSTRYVLTVLTKGGCRLVDSTLIVVGPKLTIACLADTGVCKGGSVRLWARGASTYTWSPIAGLDNPYSSQPVCTPTHDMMYRVTGVSGSCNDTQFVHVRVSDAPSFTMAHDTIVCASQSVRIQLQGSQPSVQYSWLPKPETQSAVGDDVVLRTDHSTTYYVTARSATFCETRDSIRLNIGNSLQFNVNDSLLACMGEELHIKVLSSSDSMTTYTLEPPTASFDASAREFHFTVAQSGAQQYLVHAVRDFCHSIDTVYVQVKDLPSIRIEADTIVCYAARVQLKASTTGASAQFRWTRDGIDDSLVDNPSSDSPMTVALFNTTTFHVDASESGCTDSREFTIQVAPQLLVQRSLDTTMCIGDVTQLHASVPNMRSVRWEPSTGLDRADVSEVLASPQESTVYTVNMVDSLGCAAQTQLRVDIQPIHSMRLSLGSITEALGGADTSFAIYASSDVPITTPLEFTVRCKANIFASKDVQVSDTVINQERFVGVTIPMTNIDSEVREIARIHGTVLAGPTSYSNLDILSVRSAPGYCTHALVQPGIIQTALCFQQGRGIELIRPLRMLIAPQPVDRVVALQILSSPPYPIDMEIIDVLGRSRIHSLLDLGTTSTSINMSDCEDGMYILIARCAGQRLEQTIVKREGN